MNGLIRMLRAAAFGVVCSAVAVQAALAVPPAAAPAAVSNFEVGSLHVTQYGSGAKTLVFIPGLTCGPWEWSGEIAHFAPDYTIYALTLPGFDGQPAISGPLFQTVTSDFWKLLAEKHIAHPVVIGHSLGGTTGFMLATQHPDRLAGVIAVDGLPIYPGNDRLTPDVVKAQAAKMGAMMAAQPAATFANSLKTYSLPYMLTAPSDVAAVALLAGKSDPAAAGAWYEADMALDLRTDLHKATVPIVEIAPYDVTLDGQYAPTSADKQRYYASLIANAPKASVVMIQKSRHFIMYDQPQALTDAITQSLAKM